MNSKLQTRGLQYKCNKNVKNIKTVTSKPKKPDCVTRAIAKQIECTPPTKTMQVQNNAPLSFHNRFQVLDEFISVPDDVDSFINTGTQACVELFGEKQSVTVNDKQHSKEHKPFVGNSTTSIKSQLTNKQLEGNKNGIVFVVGDSFEAGSEQNHHNVIT